MKPEKYRMCPACLHREPKTLGEKNKFLMLVCQNCDSIYSSYLPQVEESENYDEYYDENNLSVPDFIIKRIEEIVDDFRPFYSSGRLLDVGFGAGTVMQAATNKGWDVTGIEVSKPAMEQAERLGYKVFHGELSDAKFPDDYFDVVTASEIIEHCAQPELLLNEVKRILRPGGLFWATTPSAKGLSFKLVGLDWTIICPPEHLQLFSKEGIKILLEKAGFSDFAVWTFGFNPIEIINNYRGRFKKSEAEFDSHSRVETSYSLNESLSKSPVRKKVKNTLNNTLNVTGMGDSLKIKAIK